MDTQQRIDTSQTYTFTLELIPDEREGDPASVTMVGNETIESLQREGSTIQPISTGTLGGGLLVEVTMTVVHEVVIHHTEIAEAIADLSGLVAIFGGIIPVIKKVFRAQKHHSGDDPAIQPILCTVEIDGIPFTIEAAEVEQVDAVLANARRFATAHPTQAAQVTPNSVVKIQGRVSRRRRGPRHRNR